MRTLIPDGALSTRRLAILPACAGLLLVITGCGSAQAAPSPSASQAAQVAHVTLVAQIDAATGAPGGFTGKDGWPAFAPNDLHVPAHATVVLTIKDYDNMNTALPDGSPYNAVTGGTETVDGSPVTTVGNDKIAHTFTIPALGINAPLPMAPDSSDNTAFTTVVFTFKTGDAGTYTFQCFTPCGGDPNGMGGAMASMGWMKGHLIVG